MQIEKIEGAFPNLRVRLGEKEVSLHSAYPYREAERIVKHFNSAIPVVVVAGVGLGYVVDYILTSTRYTVIAYEHDESFAPWNGEILRRFEATGRVKVFRGDPQILLDYLAEEGIGELNLFIHRPYAILFPEVYDRLHGMLTAYLSRRQINQATARRFQKLWVRNVLKNSVFYPVLPGVKELFGSGKGYPAVIIGAGPSLVKNASLLKEAKKRHWILIATDTVLSYLDRVGIEADFVVSVDPQDKNALYLLAAKQRPFLILDSGASFLTLVHYPLDRVFLYDTVLPVYRVFSHLWGEKGELQCGGSVSTTAFDFAVQLGCEPLVFVGQDLAYSWRQTHTPHNILEDKLLASVDRYHTYEGYNASSQTFSDRIEVRGWDRQSTVLTDRKFLTFKDWFVRRCREVAKEVMNATEGGMFIEGMKHLPLKEVLEQVPQPSKAYDVSVRVVEKGSDEAFEHVLDHVRRRLGKLRQLLAKKEPERELLEVVKEDPILARLVEMTMQESIQKLLSVNEVDQKLLTFLRKEIREGIDFLEYMIDKRLAMRESLLA
ncbi:motility associated factor glycosyltransferase family protein [Thermospira aquatica]|uniref:DUF115 domain-containing protein n=1 Tax=Thermospira aquatica TaxID=2828656 RepID=A0AAX3BAZ3_9SPIR|nr:6-hydroxymethylpterin diphosphokinase MptE-like protein [Thermospira aquatica]URA09441.1 DUF115 domain-containing protein [Thermospira aquatica]